MFIFEVMVQIKLQNMAAILLSILWFVYNTGIYIFPCTDTNASLFNVCVVDLVKFIFVCIHSLPDYTDKGERSTEVITYNIVAMCCEMQVVMRLYTTTVTA